MSQGKQIKSPKKQPPKKQVKPKPAPNKVGKPSKYNRELALSICEETSTTSASLKTICKKLGLKPRTVLDWLYTNQEFSQMYARSKEEQADLLAEEILAIADDSSNDTIHGEYGPMENKEWVNRSRLRVDSRKWIASKLKPRKYGDKLELGGGLDQNHTFNGPIEITVRSSGVPISSQESEVQTKK